MPDQINKVSVEGTTYQITPSDTGTFEGTSEDNSSPSSWTTVAVLSSGETNGSIFTKISQMFKNIRFLYSRLGSVDISTSGSSITDAIANLESNKSNTNHTHAIATTAAAGFMPSLLENDTTKFLRSDGTWVKPAGAEYDVVTTAANGLMTSTDKIKLNTIDTSANNYTHPTYTSAANGLYKVTVDSTGHVSATEAVAKSDITDLGIPAQDTTYANFTSAAAGLVPAAKSGSTNYATSGYVLTGAGWKAGTKYNTNTTYANATTAAAGLLTAAHFAILNASKFTGATTAAAGSKGLVPPPSTAQRLRFLRGDATWATPTDTTYAVFTGATTAEAGEAGLVLAPTTAQVNYFLKGNRTWAVPTNTTYAVMTGATTAAAGATGLVPAPAAGAVGVAGRFLCADKAWRVPQGTTYGTNVGCYGTLSGTTLTLNTRNFRV